MEQHHTPDLPWFQWHLLHAELRFICQSDHKQDKTTSLKQHDRPPYHTAIWLNQGEIQVAQGSQAVTLYPRDWIFLPSGKPFSISMLSQATWTQVSFTMDWFGSQRMFFSQDVMWKIRANPHLEEQTSALLKRAEEGGLPLQRELFQQKEVDISDWFRLREMFDGWMCAWTQEMARLGKSFIHEKDFDQRILSAVRYLENLPLDHNPDITGCARSLNLSTSYFSRLFRKEFGISAEAYRMQLKLDFAIRKLTSSRDSMQEIATQLGFSQTWLNIWLKRETGQTPSQIRKLGSPDMLQAPRRQRH